MTPAEARAARLTLGLSQAQLSRLMCLADDHYRHYEGRGVRTMPPQVAEHIRLLLRVRVLQVAIEAAVADGVTIRPSIQNLAAALLTGGE